MDQQSAQPVQPSPPAETPAPPAQASSPSVAVADQPIIDRSNLQSMYPEASSAAPSFNTKSYSDASANDTARYATATHSFNDIIVLLCGLAAPLSYILTAYYSKNKWATIIVSLLLAGVAIFFAIKNYRSTDKLSPLSVIGISGATFAVVTVGNLLLSEALLRSTY